MNFPLLESPNNTVIEQDAWTAIRLALISSLCGIRQFFSTCLVGYQLVPGSEADAQSDLLETAEPEM